MTDGGHRENLGLVELLRRRCRVIVCIDASGDPPRIFSTLTQAARLARTECHAKLELLESTERTQAPARNGRAGSHDDSVTGDQADSDEDSVNRLDELRSSGPYDLAKSCAVAIPITYDQDDDRKGILLNAKAVVPEDDDVLASIREEDPDFPNYSTGNQFLTTDQALMLIRLGSRMAEKAIQIAATENQQEIQEAMSEQFETVPESPSDPPVAAHARSEPTGTEQPGPT